MKKIFLIITIGLFTISAFAQNQQKRHEVSIYAGGGLSSLQYEVNGGDHKMGLGGLAGVGYNFFFNYNWSVGVGAEFSLLQAKTEFPRWSHMSYQPGQGVAAGRLFEIHFAGRDLEEKQMAYYLNVPVKVQYQTNVFKSAKFYAAIGAKFGYAIMPAEASYGGSFTTYAWEVNANKERLGKDPYYDLPKYGFTTIEKTADREFDLDKLNIIGTVEAGLKWKAGKTGKNSWYTGLFFDYGFSDVRKHIEEDQVRPEYMVYNGLNGYNANSVIESNLVRKVNTMSAGVKVAYAFGFGNWLDRKVKAAPVEKPFEGVTPEQMEQLLNKNTGIIVDAMDRNFAELKEMLKKEEPELFEAIPTDAFSIVQFDFDKDNVKPVYYPDIDRKVEILKRYPQVRMTLVGHTDDRGTEQYNYQLGLERAQQVKDYMVKHGIDANRLFVESKGKSQPIYPNSTEDNRYKNRRVEFQMKE